MFSFVNHKVRLGFHSHYSGLKDCQITSMGGRLKHFYHRWKYSRQRSNYHYGWSPYFQSAIPDDRRPLWWDRISVIRDRPFNLQGGGMVFCFVHNFFFEQHKSSNFLLLFKARNFFPEFNIRLYDKNSESDYSFFLHQNQNILLNKHWKSEYCFRKKTKIPPGS